MYQHILWILLQVILLGRLCYTGESEKRLLRYLFDTSRPNAHNVLERPVRNESEALEVRVKFTVTQLMDVDEKNQVTITNIWLEMIWVDYHFQWDPAEYNNIRVLNVQPVKIWRPDILLYNSANERFDAAFPVNVLINYNGRINYIPPGIYKSSCTINISWFPFDEQMCVLKFGSWTHNLAKIDLRIQCDDSTGNQFGVNQSCSIDGDANTDDYQENGEWKLISAKVRRNTKKYDCCPEVYVDLKLTMILRRRPLYYTFNFILPCALISAVSLLVFALPPNGGQKISFGVTILLSLTMFLILISNNIPQTSTAVPLLGIYFLGIIVLCTLSLTFTIIGLAVHHTHAALVPVPYFVHVYINFWLAKFIFMDPFKKGTEDSPASDTFVNPTPNRHGMDEYPVRDRQQMSTNVMELTPFSHSTSASSLLLGGGNTKAMFGDGAARYRGLREDGRPPFRQQRFEYNANNPRNESYSLLANLMKMEKEIRATPLQTQLNNPYQMSENRFFGNAQSNNLPNNTRFPPFQSRNPHGEEPPPPDYESYLNAGARSSGQKSSGETQPDCTTKTKLILILQELKYITRKMREDEEEALATSEWQYAARVVDRFCLIVFSAATVITTVASLGSAPRIFDS